MKKTILTITTAFIIVLAVVMAKNCFSYKLDNNAMGIRNITAKGSVDYLFIGASSYRKGIDTHLLEDNFSENAYVVTYNGNEPMNIELELEQMYKAGTKIGTLVVEFDPSMIERGADLSDKRLLWDIDFESKVKLWNLLAKREDADFFMFYDYWVASNIDYMFTYPVSFPLISKRYYKGGNNGQDALNGKTANELSEMPIKEDPGFNELERNALLNIISMCKNNNTRLLFIECPKYKTMYLDNNYAEKDELLRAFLLEQNAEFYAKEALDFDYNDPSNYSDLTHMSITGLHNYTEALIAILKKCH